MNDLLISIAIASGCMIIPALLQYWINLKRRNRNGQGIIPFISPVYFVIVIVLIFIFFEDIAEIVPPALLGGLYQGFFGRMVLVLNTAVFVAYLVVKAVLVIICKILFSKEPPAFPAKLFYEYDDNYQVWLLKDSRKNIRGLFKGLTAACLALSSLLLGIMEYTRDGQDFSSFIFPVLLVIETEEIFCFLNGLTKEEYVKSVDGDDARVQKIRNYYRVREIYEKLFPRNILAAMTSFEYVISKGTIDVIEELKHSDYNTDKLVSQFFDLRRVEEIYNADCIEATAKLVRGENVIFTDPFYKDLGKYVVLEMINTLLSGKKCLFVIGRSSTRDEITKWAEDLLGEYVKLKSLWRVRALSYKEPDCEVGVINFSQLYDLKLIEANRELLHDVEFVFMSEPSLIINTGQIGLSILAEEITGKKNKPVYCVSDRISSGLVDTLSHLLHAEFTEVVASPMPKSVCTSIAWNADGDYLRQRLFGKQTQYLGNGTELAAVAIRNQVPLVKWYGEKKVPIRDIKWIVGQYYPILCKYMSIPSQQQSIYERIDFKADLWGAEEGEEEFIIAEDEFNNYFGMLRMFLSRGRNQSFVNILSENYMLRDYMRCNPQLFITNPNAVPSLVPDYAKSLRNTLIQLLLEMTFKYVSEGEVIKQFGLAGIDTTDAFGTISRYLRRYTDGAEDVFEVKTLRESLLDGDDLQGNYYKLNDEKFTEYFGDSLKTAYFVCEDEETGTEYIDATLMGLVTQRLLPGQYITYNGKYYYVKSISTVNGVVLRRASKAFNVRKYYRQIRRYDIAKESIEVVEAKKVMDITITRFTADISALTTGYLEMTDNGNLKNSRLYDLSLDPGVEKYYRKYKCKNVITLELPKSDEKIRFTLCLLLSELIKSVLPDGWPYVAIVSARPEGVEGYLNYLVYELGEGAERDRIYIIEDSEVDLGITDVIERNIIQLTEMITDYLTWHFEKMREPKAKDPEITTPEFPPYDAETGKKRASFFNRISKLFNSKKVNELKIKSVEEIEKEALREEKANETKTGAGDKEAKEGEIQNSEVNNSRETKTDVKNIEYAGKREDESWNPDDNEDPDYVAIDGTDIFDNSYDDGELLFKDIFEEMHILPEETRYQKECFLKFGFDDIEGRLELEEVKQYLTARGFYNSSYTKARNRESIDENDTIKETSDGTCDFCGLPLNGISYERLTDGRVRCGVCSATAIDSVEEFRKLFSQTVQIMESFYNIEYKTAISVAMNDAKFIAKAAGHVFTPTTVNKQRIVGYAEKKNDSFRVHVENGSPRLATIQVVVHEMTHIWQYLNWNTISINSLYETEWKRDIVYEGMAEWAAIQYLYMIGEDSYAHQQELLLEKDTSAYGEGFKMYCTKYPIIKDYALLKISPFTNFPPI